MKLEKMIERENRIKDNVNFEKDQKAFLRHWKQRVSMKENHHGWKSLLSSGLGYGKMRKNSRNAMDRESEDEAPGEGAKCK